MRLASPLRDLTFASSSRAQDYANPSRWGESGFARFIVAVCTLSSRRSSLSLPSPSRELQLT